MRVQYIAARRRIGRVIRGDATTTERAIPFTPDLLDQLLDLSRPRRPTRPTMVMSASVKRVIMQNMLLPTPATGKKPKR